MRSHACPKDNVVPYSDLLLTSDIHCLLVVETRPHGAKLKPMEIPVDEADRATAEYEDPNAPSTTDEKPSSAKKGADDDPDVDEDELGLAEANEDDEFVLSDGEDDTKRPLVRKEQKQVDVLFGYVCNSLNKVYQHVAQTAQPLSVTHWQCPCRMAHSRALLPLYGCFAGCKTEKRTTLVHYSYTSFSCPSL